MPQPYELIQSERLDLWCLTADELMSKSFIARSFENPHQVFTGEDLPRQNRVADVTAHPERIHWYYRIMVDRERNVAVGSISFHASPDERGMVEVGLGVAEPERGHGYATEALDALWTWVVNEPNVEFLRYTVSPTNAPSLAIIAKFGFPKVGEQMDVEDGLEWIFEREVSGFRSAHQPHQSSD